MPRPQLDAFEHRILTCIDFRFLSSPLYEQASPLFPTLTSPGAAFELKGPLFIPWQRRDRLALHRPNERRFCALSNCLVLFVFLSVCSIFLGAPTWKGQIDPPGPDFPGQFNQQHLCQQPKPPAKTQP